MVNCVLAGNTSTTQGGGVFNSMHTPDTGTPELYMHNCLIAGNVADGSGNDDIGGGVFNGLGSDPAIMELVHCTIVGNDAGYMYGGAGACPTRLPTKGTAWLSALVGRVAGASARHGSPSTRRGGRLLNALAH